VFSPELPHQLRHAPQLALRVIRIESLAQAIRSLFCFELQQQAIQQRELLTAHAEPDKWDKIFSIASSDFNP